MNYQNFNFPYHSDDPLPHAKRGIDNNPCNAYGASTTVSTTPAFTVSEVNTLISDVLTANIQNNISVEGEVSNLSVARSGHRYFSLKDSDATIKCSLFKGSAARISRDIVNNLKDGDKIVVKANVSVYKPRGEYQLIVSDIESAGYGALAKAFAALKQKLDSAGYTSQERKQRIPSWAKTIAVVTSPTGAAVRDVVSTLKRRAAFIDVVIYPTLVQGQEAPQQIVKALHRANSELAGLNATILLVRGGGSLEDLQAFNDEQVAMAVVNSQLPIISGVGHETDFTIVDFVSDLRAATPTAAAEAASPDKQALQQSLNKQKRRLWNLIQTTKSQRQQEVRYLYQRLSIQHPQTALEQKSQRLDELMERLSRTVLQRVNGERGYLFQCVRHLHANSPQQSFIATKNHLLQLEQGLHKVIQGYCDIKRNQLDSNIQSLYRYPQRIEVYKQQIKGLDARLTLLSPLGVLGRGYALAYDDKGNLLRKASDVAIGDNVCIRFDEGEVSTIVQNVFHGSDNR